MRASIYAGLASLVLIAAAGVMGADGPAASNVAAKVAEDKWVVSNSLAPRLNVVEVAGGNQKAPAGAVVLEKLDIQVAIAGPLAETTVTVSFQNTTDRVLEGELEFPLPEGAAVAGYGLDVGGTIVDGVPVEKMRARQVFESEQRKGVDPGILEQTKGNNFKTRISPIPAKGTRLAKIKFISAMARIGGTTGGGAFSAAYYSLPLAIPGKLSNASVRVEVAGKEIKPTIAGLEGLAFAAEGNKLVASKEFHNVELKGALSVTIPEIVRQQVWVEKRARIASIEEVAAGKQLEDEYYFLVAVPAMAHPPAVAPKPTKFNCVAVYWDASLSREKADKAAEIETLKELCKQNQELRIDVAAFSNVMQKAVSFQIKNGDAAELVKFLECVRYDGATDLSALQFALDVGQLGFKMTELLPYDMAILVSDGISTLGSGTPGKSKVAVVTICGGAQADYAMLRRIVDDAPAGRFLNLQTMKPGDAVSAMRFLGASGVLRVEHDEKQMAAVFPRGAQPMYGPLLISGKLLAAEGAVTLNYGGGTADKITIKRADAVEGSIVSRHWAGQKIADLSTTPEKSGDELLALGKQFGMVTPNTSLMVLERVEQYVEHGIVPPKSHPTLYKQFAEMVEKRGVEQKKIEAAKIDRVLAMWKGRVEWWEKDFSKVVVTARRDQNKELGNGEPRNNAVGGQVVGASDAHADGERQLIDGLTAARRGASPAPSPSTPARETSGFSNNNSNLAGTGSFGGMPGTAPSQTGGDLGVRGEYALQSVGPDRIYGGKQTGGGPVTSIKIKEYDAKAPYIDALKAAKPEDAYAVFIEQRKTFGGSPGFYLDCADFFLKAKQDEIAIRILTDIAELKLESAPLLRIAAYRLMQIGQHAIAIDLFEKAKALRPDEPQSWRDLAQAVAEDAMSRAWDQSRPNMPEYRRQRSDLFRAMSLYNHVIMNNWERFPEIEVTALMEANALWEKIQKNEGGAILKDESFKNPLDARLIKNLGCDLRIVMTWDADMTDIDLHVAEPTGETAYYSYNRTQAGGLVSRDFTQGYGPEEYVIKNARPGKYVIKANYFGSNQQALTGPVTVQATVITNFGKPDEKRESMTLRLAEKKEMITIGEVEIK